MKFDLEFVKTPEGQQAGAKIGDTPSQFSQMRGSYEEVSKRAVELNGVQDKSKFRWWTFYPHPTQEAEATV